MDIIALGIKAFRGLSYCGDMFLFSNGQKTKIAAKKYKMSDLIDNQYKLEIATSNNSKQEFTVFPVYHCGSYSRKNRPYGEKDDKDNLQPGTQLNDWHRIAVYANSNNVSF